MDRYDVTNYRLFNQGISTSHFGSPFGVVSHLGAVQAQDYPASLWAIGLRCKEGTTKQDVEDAISKKRIVRTWSMRQTIHLNPYSNVKWMLALYRRQIIPNYQKKNGLDEKILERGMKAIGKAFGNKEQLTYSELHDALKNTGISTLANAEVTRHIIRRAGREGLICFGTNNGKRPTFALLERWIPKSKLPDRKRALANHALQYFTSHGPATIHDFLWWSGLGSTDARTGLNEVSSKLRKETIEGKIYYMSRVKSKPESHGTAHLLPAFDEYIISYEDRSAMLSDAAAKKRLNSNKVIFAYSNGVFLPTIILDGQVIGTWKARKGKRATEILLDTFRKVSRIEKAEIKEEAERYGRFLEEEIRISG